MAVDLLRQNVIHPISTQELERRWAAVRKVMRRNKVDFLLIQNSEDYLGGYVKWFTDMPAVHGYPVSVIFPVADGMTTFWHGSSHPKEVGPPEYLLRGVKKRVTTPIMLALNFTTSFAAEKVVEELKGCKKCRGLRNAHAIDDGIPAFHPFHCLMRGGRLLVVLLQCCFHQFTFEE